MRNTIAVCTTQTYEEEFLKNCLSAVYLRAKKYGLQVQLFCTFEQLNLNSQYTRGENSIFELINYDQLCGMILFCANMKDEDMKLSLIENGRKNGIPVVLLDQKLEGCYSITFDQSDAVETVTRHLIEVHNCKNFYIMGGTSGNPFSEGRIAAARRVITEHGLELKPENIGYGDFWEGPCRREMERFLSCGRPLPDAFIAANDLMAIAICDVLREKGFRVPQDTIVTGFDGSEEELYAMPRLTTCEQDVRAGGEHAVDLIWDLANKRPVERDTVIPFRVRFSQSCGCAPIHEHDASAKVQAMFRSGKVFKQFNRFMCEMSDAVTQTRSLDGVLDTLAAYLGYMETFRHIYLCVQTAYLEPFEEMNARIARKNHHLGERVRIDTVLLGEWHADSGFEVPLLSFDHRDQLPPKQKSDATDYLMFISLHVQDTVMGYLAVEFDPTRNDYNQLRNFSANLSHILDSVRSHQQMLNFNYKLQKANNKLEDLYIRDPLTGIFNRRGFYQNIVNLVREHNYGWVLTVSADLNGLKEINDTYGHGEGDFAIRTVGRMLDKIVSERGICARFGGDEFSAAVFYDEYEQYAEQDFRSELMRQLKETDQTAGKPYPITCSFGTQMTMIDRDLNIDEALKEADRKMYADKKQHYEMLASKKERL